MSQKITVQDGDLILEAVAGKILLTSSTDLTLDSPIFILEQAAANTDVVAYGQFWVRDDAPNVPMFTDDAGTDFVLNAAASAITVTDTVSTSTFITMTDNATGNEVLLTDGGLTYNAGTAALTTTTFVGALTGDATGLSVALVEISGGTNQTTYATGDILYASGINTLTKLAVGANTEVLTLAAGIPSWVAPIGGGNVSNTGIPLNNQLAVWTTSTVIEGDPTLTFSAGTLTTTTFSGALSGNADTTTAFATARTIGMTGDILWTSAAFDGSANVTGISTIQADAVTYAQIQNVVANNVLLGNNAGVGSVVTELTGADVNLILPNFTSTLDGLAPLSGGGITNFLRADGIWVAPAGGGNVNSTGVPLNNQLAIWTDASTIEGDANLTWDAVTFTVTGALQVDNLNFNGNTLSSTAGIDLLITPLAGQQLILDGTIIIDAGVVTGATSITSTGFTGALTGNADTATAATNITVSATTSLDTTTYPLLVGANTATDQAPFIDNIDLSYNASSGALTATTFIGALSGNATSATTATTATTATGATNINISATTSVDLTTYPVLVGAASAGNQLPFIDNLNLSYNASTNALTSTTFIGALTGNANTATSAAGWTTGRTITLSGDVSGTSPAWDGTSNLAFSGTVVANDSHTHNAVNLTGTTLAAGVTASSLTSVGTIGSGTWQGTTIAVNQGGTGQTTYTNGQLLIGNTTGNTLTKATLTAGAGINITNGTGTITIIGVTASLTNAGIVELATIIETNTGTDATRAVTPDGLDGWTGSAQVVTLGTIGTGTWQGTTIAATQGGTAQSTYATGDILYASAPNTLTKLTAGANTNILTLAGGVPTWAAPTGGVPTAITVANEAVDATSFISFFTTPTGNLGPKTNAGLTFNAATADLNSTLIAGIANANLVDKTAIESITQTWTWSGGNGNIELVDLADLRFGTGNDVIMFFNGDMHTDMNATVDWRLLGGSSGNKQMITAIADGAVELSWNNAIKIVTQDHTAAGATSGGTVEDGDGNPRNIGFNETITNANSATGTITPFAQNNVGQTIYWTGATATNADTYASTGVNQTDTPPGAMWFFQNNGAGTLTFRGGLSVTIRYWSGAGTAPADVDVNIARGGIATVRKASNTVYDIWGIGLS